MTFNNFKNIINNKSVKVDVAKNITKTICKTMFDTMTNTNPLFYGKLNKLRNDKNIDANKAKKLIFENISSDKNAFEQFKFISQKIMILQDH